MASKTRTARSADAAPNTLLLREQMRSGRTRDQSSARDPAAAPFDTDDEAAGRTPSPEAIELAMARHGGRRARTPSAVGPVGRAVLLIGSMTLVALFAVWLVLVV